jgi:hypothetical protein
VRFLWLAALFIGATFMLVSSPAGVGPRFAIGALLSIVSLLGIFVSLATLAKHRIN